MASIKRLSIDKITYHYLTETFTQSGERVMTNPCINVFCGKKVFMINPEWSDVVIMPRRIYEKSNYKRGVEISSFDSIPQVMHGLSSDKEQ